MNLILGDGLGLRMPVPADRERWLELCYDPEQRFGSPAFVPIPEHVGDLDERITESSEKYAAGEPTNFVVVEENRPDVFLGTIGWYFHLPPKLQIADVGYSVHADARGRGVASRGLRTIARWLTVDDDGPRVARVQLDHSIENPASCHVALNAGFVQEGIRASYLPLRDPSAPDGVRRHAVCMHGLVPA